MSSPLSFQIILVMSLGKMSLMAMAVVSPNICETLHAVKAATAAGSRAAISRWPASRISSESAMAARGLEKAREACRHACHEQNAGSVLHVDFRTHVVAEGGANLHRHALAARTAPEEVRDPGRHHDERDEAERNFLLLAVRDIENDSHAAFRALSEFLVREHDGDAPECERRNPVQRVCIADCADAVEHLAEESGKRTDDGSEEQGRNGEYRLREPAGELFLDFFLGHFHGLFLHLRTHVPVDVLPVVEIHRKPFFFRRQI